MSTVHMRVHYQGSSPLFNIHADRGVSQEAVNLQEGIKRISTALSQSIVLGGKTRETVRALNEVLEEHATPNWDGYGAKAVDFGSYLEAERFIHSLPITVPSPEITVEPDGEIAFEWRNGPRCVFSVSMGNNGELTYAGLFGRSKTHGTEYFGDGLPRTILDNIQRVFATWRI